MIADVLIKFFETLDLLHKEYGFVHGDMHGENIMLRNNMAVLIDMGFSCREQKDTLIAVPAVHGVPVRDHMVGRQRADGEWLWFLRDIQDSDSYRKRKLILLRL